MTRHRRAALATSGTGTLCAVASLFNAVLDETRWAFGLLVPAVLLIMTSAAIAADWRRREDGR